VEGLIADGSDINAKERSGQEALHYAAMMGSADITMLLIEAGAVRSWHPPHPPHLSASATLLLPAEC
jgi:ankyrin repeat protein